MHVKKSARYAMIAALVVVACGIGGAFSTAGMAEAQGAGSGEAAGGGSPVQTAMISVTTDRSEYVHGDVVIISGEIATSLADTPVILQIFKDGNPVYINQITPAGDNTYWDIVKAEGTRWERAGTYEVSIRYGTDGKAAAAFNFVAEGGTAGGQNGAGEITGTMEVDAGNETFDVEYAITGGTVSDMMLDWRDFTLVVEIGATSGAGSITMELPRKYIGAEVTQGRTVTDDIFIVLIDGVQTTYEERASSQSARKISVDFVEGDSEIRVIGTYAVPEFTHIVIVGLVSAGMLAAIAAARMAGRVGTKEVAHAARVHPKSADSRQGMWHVQ